MKLATPNVIIATISLQALLITSVMAGDYMEVAGDHFCPSGQRLMSYSYAQKHKKDVCNTLKDWAIARLAGNGSISGAGNNCEIYNVDHRTLGTSLCVPLQSFNPIRGILLRGGFRTQAELNQMSEQDWRQTLVTELANRTANSSDDYDKLGNAALAGAGRLVILHLTVGQHSPSQIAKFTQDELRKSTIYDLNKQTGIPIAQLSIMSDMELVDLFLKG